MSEGKEGKEHKIANAVPFSVRTRGDKKGEREAKVKRDESER